MQPFVLVHLAATAFTALECHTPDFPKFSLPLSKLVQFEFFTKRSNLHCKPDVTSKGFKKFQQKINLSLVGIEPPTLAIDHWFKNLEVQLCQPDMCYLGDI